MTLLKDFESDLFLFQLILESYDLFLKMNRLNDFIFCTLLTIIITI